MPTACHHTGEGHATMTRYTIRYRCEDSLDATALVVEDRRGTAYLFSGGQLHVQLSGDDACARLVELLGRRATCIPVPEVDPYTLEGLRRLTAEAAHALPAMTGIDARSWAGNGVDHGRARALRPGRWSGLTASPATAIEG